MRFPLLAAVLLVAAAAPASAQPQAPLPTIQLTAGMHLIKAEVAADFGTRMQGLMFRESLGANAGMLFVFDEPGDQCMWMKNTLIPLSVAFVDPHGVITNIEDMRPQTEETHCARRPALFALEMSKGWFAQRGIKAGMKLGGLDRLSARR